MSLPALPDRLFAIPILTRGIVIWSTSRAALALGTWLISGTEQPPTLEVTRAAAVWMILLVGALGMIEVRRRNEHLLLANLGCGQPVLAALAALPALIGEMTIALLADDAAAGG